MVHLVNNPSNHWEFLHINTCEVETPRNKKKQTSKNYIVLNKNKNVFIVLWQLQ